MLLFSVLFNITLFSIIYYYFITITSYYYYSFNIMRDTMLQSILVDEPSMD